MKKFRITDDEGNNYEVEEIEEVQDEEKEFKDDELSEGMSLTQDEIISLKELAAKAPEILALLNNNVVDAKEEEVKDEDKEEKVEDEEVIDSEDVKEKNKVKDSKKSYGSIETKYSVNDSIDAEDEIANAWAKRYGGK